jgi:Ion channel
MAETRQMLPEWARSVLSLAFLFLVAFATAGISISTVGYGDIVPHSSVARLLASVEVVCGFMLLLFGVSELLEYTREHRGEARHPRRSSRGQ